MVMGTEELMYYSIFLYAHIFSNESFLKGNETLGSRSSEAGSFFSRLRLKVGRGGSLERWLSLS